MSNQSAEWIISCPRCGKAKQASAAGVTRISAWSLWKRTLAYCTDCRKIRWARVEKKITQPENHTASQVILAEGDQNLRQLF